MDYLVHLHETTEVNAVVFDIKDYSGEIDYRIGIPDVKQYGALRITIRDIDALVRRLHGEGLYLIARLTVFQDPILARARPEWAIHRRSLVEQDGVLSRRTLWLDRKGLAWIDPASRPAWNYIAAIARDVLSHGFDELNFDYVRFPSDGNLKDMQYPSWDGKTPRHEVVAGLFSFLRKELGDAPLSADLFGLSTVNEDDLGIGQVIEDGFADFDYVCPMVYPSHFARKFLGFMNPADHPYDVVNYSMKKAAGRLPGNPATRKAKLRPWLQDFNLGAKYDAGMVKAQIQAVQDALGDRFAGYMMWAPSNVYTAEALK
jgi:hypothetical protein